MKRSHSLLAITSLIGTGLVAAAYRSERPPVKSIVDSARPRVGGSEIAEASELAQLRRDLARLQVRVRSQDQRMLAAELSPAAANQPSSETDPRRAPESRAEAELKHREYMAGVDAAFRSETTDTRWSSASANLISAAALADDNLKPLVRAVECRSRTCRVEIADDGTGNLGDIIPMFAHRLGSELPSLTANRVEGPSGATTMVLYLTAPGAPAPAR